MTDTIDDVTALLIGPGCSPRRPTSPWLWNAGLILSRSFRRAA
jgi:hypothetical protein